MRNYISDDRRFDVWNSLQSLVKLLEDPIHQNFTVSNFNSVIKEKREAVDELRKIFIELENETE